MDNKWVNTIRASPPLSYNMDTAIIKLKQHYPLFTCHIIYFAQSNKGKTAIYGSNKNNSFIHSKKFADVVYLDSAGNIAGTRFIDSIPAADRYDIINAQIHFGKYGGMPVKIIYSLLGLLTGLMSVTGILLWLKRNKAIRN